MEEQNIKLMLQSALPIDDIDQVGMVGGNSAPVLIIVVWIDTQERPDLAELAARHGRDNGYFLSTWFAADPGERKMIIGLRVDMRGPVKTVFHLAFKVEKYLQELEILAQYGQIWIVPGPPPAGLTGTSVKGPAEMIAIMRRGVTLEVEPSHLVYLREQLTAWKQRR